eukprot:scaffold1541_cov256-Pinguiococcus_pyrenoidosus.AAC.31
MPQCLSIARPSTERRVFGVVFQMSSSRLGDLGRLAAALRRPHYTQAGARTLTRQETRIPLI